MPARDCALLVFLAGTSAGQYLKDVRTIFVDSLGGSDGAAMIREKLTNRLAQSRTVRIVSSPGMADAILNGVASVSKGRDNEGYTTYSAALSVELISKDKRLLWTGSARPGSFAGSVSSSVAGKVARDLLKAIETDRRPVRSKTPAPR